MRRTDPRLGYSQQKTFEKEETAMEVAGSKWLVISVLFLAGLCAGIVAFSAWPGAAVAAPAAETAGPESVSNAQNADDYVVLTWNDLGMH